MPVISDIVTTTRASTGTYFDSSGVMRTAANNVWRRDHDPLTREPLGVLIEEQRTNLCSQSQTFDSSAWTPVAVSNAAGALLSLDGVSPVALLTESSASGTHYVRQTFPATAEENTYSATLYFHQSSTRNIQMRIGASPFGTSGNRAYATVDVATQAISTGNIAAPNVTAKITSVGGGFFRFQITASFVTTDSVTFGIYLSDSTVALAAPPSYTGDGVSSIAVWGAQLEVGAFPTSYIPTTTAAATRAADLNYTNDVSWVNGAENSFVFDFDCPNLDNQSSGGGANSRRHLISFQTVGSSNFLYVYLQPASGRLASLQVVVTNAGNVTTHGVGPADIPEGRHRLAISLASSGQIRASVDGGAIRSATGVQSVPWSALNRVYFGSQIASRLLNGHMRMATSYPRVLSDAELQAASVLS